MEREPRSFWHTTPLHYVPYLLLSGGLLSKARLLSAGLPVRPRPTALRRDTKLGLADFVHLSLAPRTPLLADKRARGYVHVLLEFGGEVAVLPGAAFLAFNAKAWRHREAFVPITAPEEKAAFLEAWRGGRYPSAELLVPGALPLAPHVRALHMATEAEAAWLRGFLEAVPLSGVPALRTSPDLFPHGAALDLSPLDPYRDACAQAGAVLPPPDLPFD